MTPSCRSPRRRCMSGLSRTPTSQGSSRIDPHTASLMTFCWGRASDCCSRRRRYPSSHSAASDSRSSFSFLALASSGLEAIDESGSETLIESFGERPEPVSVRPDRPKLAISLLFGDLELRFTKLRIEQSHEPILLRFQEHFIRFVDHTEDRIEIHPLGALYPVLWQVVDGVLNR